MELSQLKTTKLLTIKSTNMAHKPIKNTTNYQKSTSSYTTVAYTAITASTLVLARNDNRVGFSIKNRTDVTVYFLFTNTTTATATTAHSLAMAADSYYEDPYGYTGEVRAIQSGGTTGSINITEYLKQ